MSEPLRPEHVEWAYRLLLDREAEEGIAKKTASHLPDTRALREHILRSTEYALKNGPAASAARMGDATVIAILDSYGIRARLFVNLSDYIGLSIARGEYEREEIAFLRKQLKPGQTFVDIGGNIGLFAVVGSKAVGESGRVFTIEALSRNVTSIQANLAENSFCNNVTVIKAIVGESPRGDMCIAFMPLEEGSGNSGGSFIVDATHPLEAHLHREQVRQDRLDNLIESNVNVDFIKMDIEGAEGLAMEGATRILQQPSLVILSEVHPLQLVKISGRTWQQYFDQMASFGFRPRFFEGGELAGEPGHLEDEKVYNVAFIRGA